jgi:selenocysteine lyase/cysteine desulfurase
MEMMAEWGAEAIAARLEMLTARIAGGLSGSKVRLMDPRFRSPHILSLGFPGGLPAGLVDGLEQEGIHVAARLSRMRISPHVFNDEEDADRFVAALKKRLG